MAELIRCPNCRNYFQYERRWRPKLDDRFKIPVVDGKVQMEPVDRLLCLCASKPTYPDATEWMAVEKLDLMDRRRIAQTSTGAPR